MVTKLLDWMSLLEWQKSNCSVKQVSVIVEFYDGELNGVSYSGPAIVKKKILGVLNLVNFLIRSCYFEIRAVQGVRLLLSMLCLHCFSSSGTFGMVLSGVPLLRELQHESCEPECQGVGANLAPKVSLCVCFLLYIF